MIEVVIAVGCFVFWLELRRNREMERLTAIIENIQKNLDEEHELLNDNKKRLEDIKKDLEKHQ